MIVIQSNFSLEWVQNDILRQKETSEEIESNIFLLPNSAEFSSELKATLGEIKSNPVGQRLLAKIRSATEPVFITHGEIDRAIPLYYDEYAKADRRPPVQVLFANVDTTCSSTAGETIALPKDVVLFHELTHAYHYLMGKYCASHTCDPIVWTNDEEYKTIVGFPSKKGKVTSKITENAYRLAKGLPQRFGHCGGNPLRIKLLGSRYEKRLQIDPNNLNPPPVDLCRLEDFGDECYVMAVITIQFLGSTKPASTYGWIYPNKIDETYHFDKDCYVFTAPIAFDKLKEWVRRILQLGDRMFDIHYCDFIRVSKEEYDFMDPPE